MNLEGTSMTPTDTQPDRARRPWSDEEIRFVQDNTPGMTAPQIGARLGRSKSAVYQMRENLGLTWHHADLGPRFEAFLREKHAEGWSDAEISAAWKCDRHAVGTRRRLLGLSDNTFSERRRRKVAERTAEQLKAAGLPSIGHLRKEAFRKRAAAAGWPEDLRPRAVQMLNAMWDRGPMTRRELADAVGMPWKGSRQSLTSNDPEGSYLAHLIARGLVVSFKRAGKVTGKGKGRSVDVYMLAPDIERKAV